MLSHPNKHLDKILDFFFFLGWWGELIIMVHKAKQAQNAPKYLSKGSAMAYECGTGQKMGQK